MLIFQKPLHQIFDIVAAIVKISCTWHFLSVHDLLRTYIGNVRKSRKDTFSVQVTESPFDFVLRIQLFVYRIVLLAKFCKMADFRCYLK